MDNDSCRQGVFAAVIDTIMEGGNGKRGQELDLVNVNPCDFECLQDMEDIRDT